MPQLTTINLPNNGRAEVLPEIPLPIYRSRLEMARALMQEMGFHMLVVYGDREHSATFAYLTGFDPRFEEALLLLVATFQF